MDVDYDEFALLGENREEADLDVRIPPLVRRHVDVGDGRQVAAIVWGASPAELVLLHGGAQNAHTWDTVALALALPLVAVDLPGHGHSDWRPDGDYSVSAMASDVSVAIRHLAPSATMLVGIGLGAPVGLLAATLGTPSVDKVVMVDSLAGVGVRENQRPPSQAATNVTAFTAHGHFDSFEEMLQRTVAYNPGRTERSLRRGLLHNARQLADGSWTWRWDPGHLAPRDFAFEALAEALGRFAGPVLLVRGEESDVVSDDAIEAFTQRHPRTTSVTIPGGHHALQGNRPVELARAVRTFWLIK